MPMRPIHINLQNSDNHNLEELLGPPITFEITWEGQAKKYCWSDNSIQCQNEPELAVWLGKPQGAYYVYAVCVKHIREFVKQYTGNGFIILQVVYRTDLYFGVVASKNEVTSVTISELESWLVKIESNT